MDNRVCDPNKSRVRHHRRNNFRFAGTEEWYKESRADTEQNLKDAQSVILGVLNIKVQRTHCIGD